ncbi:SCP2 sterol-binding domain-containing protein [Rhodothermus bifroesti]|uniref:SCP2 sterol-binding domain-containing protein n=1 Tax=Rhodothermus marinus TaxID=29549 RepID=A0A7V2AYB1_RHOMR|nr:SCP2 sterol-binding domain-containing protein [Rhodothermus bifroesti]GBD01637.1 hypothetical protein HRbin18_01364 [bacterium HR18]
MPKYNSIPEVIASYKERFLPDQAAGIEGVVQLNLTGEGGGAYYLVVKNGTLEIHEGTHENPTVTVTTSAENWLKLNNGEANPMALMMMGKLKVSGSLPMATKFQSMFRMG